MNIVVPSAIPTLTVGGRVFTDLQNLIILSGHANNTRNGTLRKPNGSAGYQITAGKTYQIHAAKFWSSVLSTVNASVFLAQGDTDLGLDSASAITNPVYPFGQSTTTTGIFTTTNNTGIVVSEQDFRFNVAAGKYVNIANSGGGQLMSLMTYGYEV